MILEIDAGNTRIKWRLLKVANDGVVITLKDDFFVANEGAAGSLERFGFILSELPLAQLGRVRVANVRGEAFAEFLASVLLRAGAVRPEFAASAESCAGVKNGYVDPRRLGIDRWLAMLAAYNDCRRACFVLDCGTTITLDVVASSGGHLGGYIVPGITLMRDMLTLRSTALVGGSNLKLGLQPGLDTGQAINNGLANMAAGFVGQVRGSQLQDEANPAWFVSGGDGELVQQFLGWESKYVPTLVLDGLMLALP